MPRVCITVPGQNAQPYRFSLDRETVKIGRAPENDIVIESPTISSYHCEMLRVSGGYTLNDTNSTNGIKQDGALMEIIDLANGVNVTVGDAELDFELTSEEIGTLSEEDHEPQERMKLPPAGEPTSEVSLPEAAPAPPESENAPAPARPPKTAKKKQLASAKQNGGVQFLVSLLLLALAIASFYFGMAKRHQEVTTSDEFPDGRVLYEDLMQKTKGGKRSEEPTAPPEEEAPAQSEES